MDRLTVLKTITNALTEVMQRDYSDTTENTRLFEDLHLDSTSVLTLLMALEDHTGIEVDPETLQMDDFQTIGTLADYLEANLDVAV
ncbi:acyl carrier protein [Nocardia sp. NRRL S-836]|uniref:acyl carrier protein n=1 Tax=Nocardia sp. NRRL S-836 TaxID=1519492 RepID=UPI0006ADBE9B|nr:acyl carrier protein [Nocardia sp. NRRL S-836]KOV87934.1 acyl carrier protein [Nocardia sp. NRRL S-836]